MEEGAVEVSLKGLGRNWAQGWIRLMGGERCFSSWSHGQL